tara:strand:- start:643 stop:1005 length:363 start_codon:yes stop_codon:yes gene_type:complete
MTNNKWINLQRAPEDYGICDTVLIAKTKLCEKFDVNIEDFQENTSRKSNVVEARRFLVYFLVKELDVKPTHIKWFIPSIKHHATALHHIKKMEFFMLKEVGKSDQYQDFRYSMVNGLLDD